MGRSRFVPRAFAALAMAAGAAALLTAAGPLPQAQPAYRCPATQTVIVSAARDDAVDACKGAQAAIGFFRIAGLKADKAVSIEIVARLPAAVGATAAGCFLEGGQRVVVLSYEKFKSNGNWFRVPIDRSLYRNVAAHEVAHALAAHNFGVAAPTIEAKEYVAYVATLATMSDAQRRAVLAAYAGDGFDDEAEMSTTIYLFDPMRFGVEAYRHYLKPGNGNAYLRAVLAGAVLVD